MPLNLHHIELELSSNKIGTNKDDTLYLAEALKSLPNNLQNLKLDLKNNNLINHPENMKHIL